MSTAKEISSKANSSSIDHEHGVSWLGMYELTKPRLSLLSVFTASLGFLVHHAPGPDFSTFLALTLGTALSAGGAAALNQWMERKEDALMARTSDRPIPSQLVTPGFALSFGILLSTAGLVVLWAGTNPWAVFFTFLTLLVYLCFYTPLKKKSSIAIEVGAISGALPPLIGWVAAAGSPTLYGWILFGILFAWQLPHFMAIAWNFRSDYDKGGFQLHDTGDGDGFHLARKSLVYTFFLNFLVFSPYFFELGHRSPSTFYLVCAIFLSSFITIRATAFLFSKNRDMSAKKLFIATIIYLPLLLAALVIDRYI
jgi:protoheme IX farnesyltransferase